ARRASPGDGFVRFKWGEVLLSTGRPVEAQAELREAVRLTRVKTEMVMALDMFALSELQLERPEEARKILDKVTAAAPGYMLGHLHLALAHRALALVRAGWGNESKRDPLSLLSWAGPATGPRNGSPHPSAGAE